MDMVDRQRVLTSLNKLNDAATRQTAWDELTLAVTALTPATGAPKPAVERMARGAVPIGRQRRRPPPAVGWHTRANIP